MKTPLPRPPVQGLRTWQEINQHSAGRSLSPVARRKRIIRGLGVAMTVMMAGTLGLLGAWGWKLYRHDPEQMRVADSNAKLARVNFQTDGVLTEDWIREALDLKNGDLLPQYNVFALQRHLLAVPQIREAFVERVLPDTLRIRVSERQPLLRLAVDDGAGSYKPYLVARDGTVYEGQLYADDKIHSLPWLAGVKLHHAAGGSISSVAGMDVVQDLLASAKTSLPASAQWTVVDLNEFDPRPQAPLSLIKVRSPDLGEVTFLAHDFHRQLDRLAVIAQDLHGKQLVTRGVDLSFDQQAVVQLAEPPPAPAKTTIHTSAAHTARSPAPHPTDTFAQANLRHSITP